MDSGCRPKRKKLGTSVVVVTEENGKNSSEVNLTNDTNFHLKPEETNIHSIKEQFDCEDSTSSVIGISSAKEICIAVSETNKLNDDSQHTTIHTPCKELDEVNIDGFTQCEICGIVGVSSKMLICDLCSGAFHLACCNEKNGFSEDDWYCQPCLTKEVKLSLESGTGKLFANMYQDFRRGKMRDMLGEYQFMLRDIGPHISRVRIGSEFQAQIQEWSGPEAKDCRCELLELQPAECSGLEGLTFARLRLKEGAVGNWIQCRALLDGEVICGKWRSRSQTRGNSFICYLCGCAHCHSISHDKSTSIVVDAKSCLLRAPHSVVQTDDWDCSCALVWDPIHADCAVPQELETEEILKQLRYLDSLISDRKKRRKSG